MGVILARHRIVAAFSIGLVAGVAGFFLVLHVIAATGSIEPNADGSVTSTPVSCGGGGRFDCINDGVTTSGTPSTGTDYTSFVLDNIDNYAMTTLTDVASVSQIQVNLYHVQTSSNLQFSVSLWNSAGTVQYGGTQLIPSRSAAQWDTLTYSGLSLSQAQLDDVQVRVQCARAAGGKPNNCFLYALYADVTFEQQIEVNVSSTGTQQNIGVGATNAYIGGAFAVTELISSRNVTSITIAETGTIDAQTNLSNVRLFYELDTTSPYNCASVAYDGTESQFGSATTFNAANGTATFTDSVGITTTAALCLYTVVNVGSGAVSGETIELQITNPSTDVVATGADVQPATAVTLAGSTVLQAPLLSQIHYHWRNDDGSEAAATSKTGGVDDTPNSTLGKLAPTRLRLQVSNEGNTTSAATQYRLEYAQKVTTCSVASGWTDVGASGGDFDMFDSANLTNGADTTDIAEAIGGTPNENTTFLTPNGGVRDTTSQTGNITLTSTQFVELEYSIQATASSVEGNTYCFRVTDAGTPIDEYAVYPEATILADITVSSIGAQTATVNIPTTDVYAGGVFRIVDNLPGDTTVTSITLTAAGTVDFVNDIDNIELRYDLDTTAPYDCASVSYDITDTQFGSTDTDGFTAGGLATFTGSLTVNPTQTACLYVVYDVTSGASNDETLELSITNPSTDVTIGSGTVAPAALVSIPDTTTFVVDQATQIGYHWRNDDGTEAGATSATGGNEDTIREKLRQEVPIRLRLQVSNEGSAPTPTYQYRLEYTVKTSFCSAATGWTDVGAAGGAFNMFNSPNLTDGANTTNIAVATGGTTDEAATFLTPNGGVKDTSSQTGNITLPGNNFVELEYSIEGTVNSIEGATYCFRVTNAGTPIDSYTIYPELEIKPKTDFFIQRGVSTLTGTTLTLTAGTNYIAPSSASNAFIRITNTLNTGTGAGTTGNADDVTVRISNPSNITSNITFARPAGATGNTRVAWEIIEYVGAPGGRNEIVVRDQQTATYGTGNTTVTTGTVSGIVDDNDVAVFITGQLNPDTGTNYPLGNSTAAWNGGTDTATFTRGASGNASGVSYAVVEFVGANWRVQRSQHTYTAVGSTETESITAVNSLNKAFIHTQKRMTSGLNTHGDFGHQVWLSGIGQVSYLLDSTAGTPGGHTSVAWVIENTQNIGEVMDVTRSNGTQSGGTAPLTLNTNIGKTLEDIEIASLFFTNTGSEPGGGSGQNSFPEPMISARIVSATQYELFVADTNDSRSWRAEVVEWPTAARDITQNYYRFYVNEDVLDPSDPWPVGASDVGENTEVTIFDDPIAFGEVMRIRMTAQISSAAMAPSLDSFRLQYGERTSVCSAISEGEWRNVGSISSTTALWRGFNNPSLTDGTPLTTEIPAVGALNISVSDVAATYEEENDSATTPYEVIPGEDVEFDWVVQHNGATQKQTYCFRMIQADGTLLVGYNFYPAMRTAGYTPLLSRWRFYDDETSLTPTVPLAAENTAPSSVQFDNPFKLRVTIAETTGGDGTNNKFKLQFSTDSNFATEVFDVASSTECGERSLWCYADGAGADNAVIDAAVLSDADACTGGVGNGCGTYNEDYASTTATYDQPALSIAEYEFTLRHAGARANAVYYFRLIDQVTGEEVLASTTNPSVQAEGAGLVFSITGLDSGVSTEGIVTDAATTPAGVQFGSVPLNTEFEAAQRLNIDTNATEGYQVLVYSRQELLNSYGTAIDPVTATNLSPAGWATGCSLVTATGCFGYHSGDDILSGGSTRFSATDSYAALEAEPREIMFSSVPVNESHDIVYKVQVGEAQPAGDYQTEIVYIAIPSF